MNLGRDHRRAFVTSLLPHDVLLGRGAPIVDNPGNVRFLALVRTRCTDYHQAPTRREKSAIARQIVDTIHARNGLFLRKIVSPEEIARLGAPPDVTAWTTADEKTVLLKIKQALRDRGLEARADPSQQQNVGASAESTSNAVDDEGVGEDNIVAAALSHAPPPPVVPPAKRARITGPSQEPMTGEHVPWGASVIPPGQVAAQPAMSAPARLPVAGFARFHSAPEQSVHPQVQLPLQTIFSQQEFDAGGTGPSQLSHGAQAPRQLPHGQDSTAGVAAMPSLNDSEEKMAGEENPPSSSQGTINATTGEFALEKACLVCELGKTPNDGLKLDPIEVCLLTVLISRGLPTWSSAQLRDTTGMAAMTHAASSVAYPFNWTDVGPLLVQEVHGFLSRKAPLLFPNDTPDQRGPAIEDFVSRLVAMASTYATNPTILARNTVMLLEKLRLHIELSYTGAATSLMGSSKSSGGFDSSERSFTLISDSESSRRGGLSHGRGDEYNRGNATMNSRSRTMLTQGSFPFQTYLKGELGQWASSLDIADEVGLPVPYSSNDFVSSFPEFMEYKIFSMAAILDVSGCHDVLRQVTYLTRLRSLFQRNSADQILSALRTSQQAPHWGASTIEESTQVDMSLLQGLLMNGFSDLLDTIAADEMLRMFLRHSSMAKSDVEKRTVHLTGLLHAQAQSGTIRQVMNHQSAKFATMLVGGP